MGSARRNIHEVARLFLQHAVMHLWATGFVNYRLLIRLSMLRIYSHRFWKVGNRRSSSCYSYNKYYCCTLFSIYHEQRTGTTNTLGSRITCQFIAAWYDQIKPRISKRHQEDQSTFYLLKKDGREVFIPTVMVLYS